MTRQDFEAQVRSELEAQVPLLATEKLRVYASQLDEEVNTMQDEFDSKVQSLRDSLTAKREELARVLAELEVPAENAPENQG